MMFSRTQLAKAARILGCLPLKPEQMLIVFWSVGRDVFVVLALRSVSSNVLDAVFEKTPVSRRLIAWSIYTI